MPLPSSGPISMGDVNEEFGRTRNETDTELAGSIVPTNDSLFGLAPASVNKVASHALSEFRNAIGQASITVTIETVIDSISITNVSGIDGLDPTFVAINPNTGPRMYQGVHTGVSTGITITMTGTTPGSIASTAVLYINGAKRDCVTLPVSSSPGNANFISIPLSSTDTILIRVTPGSCSTPNKVIIRNLSNRFTPLDFSIQTSETYDSEFDFWDPVMTQVEIYDGAKGNGGADLITFITRPQQLNSPNGSGPQMYFTITNNFTTVGSGVNGHQAWAGIKVYINGVLSQSDYVLFNEAGQQFIWSSVSSLNSSDVLEFVIEESWSDPGKFSFFNQLQDFTSIVLPTASISDPSAVSSVGHSGFTGPISFTVSSDASSWHPFSCILLVNGTFKEKIQTTSAGTYSFLSRTYSSSDHIAIVRTNAPATGVFTTAVFGGFVTGIRNNFTSITGIPGYTFSLNNNPSDEIDINSFGTYSGPFTAAIEVDYTTSGLFTDPRVSLYKNYKLVDSFFGSQRPSKTFINTSFGADDLIEITLHGEDPSNASSSGDGTDGG